VRGRVREIRLDCPQHRDVLDLGEDQARAMAARAIAGLGRQQRGVDAAPDFVPVRPGEVDLVLVVGADGRVGTAPAAGGIRPAEFGGAVAEQIGGGAAKQLLAGCIDPGDALVLGQQRDRDRRAVEHGAEQLLRVGHQRVHARVLDRQRRVHGELLKQLTALGVGTAPVDRHVDAQHADERAVRRVQRGQQHVVRVPRLREIARLDRRGPARDGPGRALIATVIKESQVTPGLAASKQPMPALHRGARAEQGAGGFLRSRDRHDLAHVAGPHQVHHSTAKP